MNPARLLLRLAVLALVAGAAATLTFGYLGYLHGAFDSFSHFRIHVAAGLLLLVPLLWLLAFRVEAVFALLFGATAIATTLSWQTPPMAASAQAEPPAAPVFRLLQVNLRFDNAAPTELLSLIGRVGPDVITLNEVSAMWKERLRPLQAAYPHQIVCPHPAPIGGTAILSRRPFAEGTAPECHDRGSLAIASIDFSGRIAEIAALHLGWPWPFEQPWQIPHLVGPLSRLGDTAMLAGDLNSAPWSHSVRRIAAAGDLRVLRGIGPTWLVGAMPDFVRRSIGLPIDNVMVKGGVVPLALRRLDDVSSDHLPVLLQFTLVQEEEARVQQAGFGIRQ